MLSLIALRISVNTSSSLRDDGGGGDGGDGDGRVVLYYSLSSFIKMYFLGSISSIFFLYVRGEQSHYSKIIILSYTYTDAYMVVITTAEYIQIIAAGIYTQQHCISSLKLELLILCRSRIYLPFSGYPR
jgi:hypothetical protein